MPRSCTVMLNVVDVDGIERRDGPRHEAMIPAIVFAHGQGRPCSIHNFSSWGMTLKADWPDAAIGTPIIVSSSVFAEIGGLIRWRRRGAMGVQLLKALPIDQLAAARARTPAGMKPRAGRARVRLDAVAIRDGRRRRVEICNISVGGAMISTGLPFPPGEVLTIELPDLPPLTGFIRWSRNGRCGLMWKAPLPITTARLLAERENLSATWVGEIEMQHQRVSLQG